MSTVKCRSQRTRISTLVIVAITIFSLAMFQPKADAAAFGLLVQPSSVVIKVGEKSQINITVANPEEVLGSQVCFSVGGFPASGFRTSFAPECTSNRAGGFGAVLTVEVTPAAAPQNVTATVIATSTNQTAEALLSVTVEFAMAPWIPWAGLILFFLVLGVAIAWKPKAPFKKARQESKHKRN